MDRRRSRREGREPSSLRPFRGAACRSAVTRPAETPTPTTSRSAPPEVLEVPDAGYAGAPQHRVSPSAARDARPATVTYAGLSGREAARAEARAWGPATGHWFHRTGPHRHVCFERAGRACRFILRAHRRHEP